MSYSSTTSFDSPTQILSGVLTSNAGSPSNYPSVANEPVGDVVISVYADGAVSNLGGYFAQTRTRSDGSWKVSAAPLPAGSHLLSVVANFGAVIATTTVTTAGAAPPSSASVRVDLQPSSTPRL